MTTRPITWVLSVTGDTQTEQAFNDIAEAENSATTGLQRLRSEQQSHERSQAQFQQQVNRGAQALSGLARGARTLAETLRETNPEASRLSDHLGDLFASAGQNIQQFGLLGGAIKTAFEEALPAIQESAGRLSEWSSLVQELRIAFPQLQGIIRDTGASTLTAQGARDQAAANRRRGATQALPEGVDPEATLGESDFIAQGEFQRRANERFRRNALRAAGISTGSGGRGGDDPFTPQALAQSLRESIELQKASQREMADAHNALNAQLVEQENTTWNDILQQRIATQEQLNAIQEQTHRNELRRLDQQRQAHEQLSQEIQGYAQPLVSGFVGAMSKVIAGTESAGDAFKGLLSSFLEFISQQAALKAAFEFAESLVALASFNYPGAAMHAAAGVAFTAVAVAAGAGAVATAPSSGAPASPAANQAPQGGGPSVTNIYWNSPVVTAQDHAELGRSLGQLQSRSAQRQSSSV